MITGSQLTQGYGTHIVFKGLDIRLGTGVTALLGPNGAGKSTLLRTLATVQPPRSGKLTFDGAAIDSEAAARKARRQIGYLPQRTGFEPGMRLRDFVEYAAWLRGLPSGEWRSAAEEAISRVGLSARIRSRLGRLSGGMRQRAAVAWAIAGGPRLVILDEPTVGLDPQQRFRFREIVESLEDTAVILSTHLIDDVDAIGDRVLIMGSGRIMFDGTVAELKDEDDDSAPGHTPLERAYMSLLPEQDREK
ncbi:ABC transporter ATP-binding protein [Glycomyces salinus]|uniref:ABC transporter ATP-binding protein n=1 Tax=Glycomyces salinus TaxID=980294 RepID=UPI0018EC3ADD|nr:ATP-binding cassette domain-containing protein [Glycomyces salinus]